MHGKDIIGSLCDYPNYPWLSWSWPKFPLYSLYIRLPWPTRLPSTPCLYASPGPPAYGPTPYVGPTPYRMIFHPATLLKPPTTLCIQIFKSVPKNSSCKLLPTVVVTPPVHTRFFMADEEPLNTKALSQCPSNRVSLQDLHSCISFPRLTKSWYHGRSRCHW